MARKRDFNQTLQEANSNYTTKVDEVSATVTYVGMSDFGVGENEAKWQIQKILVDGTVTTVSFANGDDDFKYVWADRASYSY